MGELDPQIEVYYLTLFMAAARIARNTTLPNNDQAKHMTEHRVTQKLCYTAPSTVGEASNSYSSR
jgi:hypothetical protein